MSSLSDFLGAEPEPVPQPSLGEEIEMAFMCDCGSTHTRSYTKDKYKTAQIVCQDCDRKATFNIPTWLRDALTNE